MRSKNHIRLLTLVSIARGLFWIGGLPEYYQQYSASLMVLFDLIILPPICFLVFRSVKSSNPVNTFRNFFWWAFYISVPLFVYDYLFCGLYLGNGAKFLVKYWYLTVYYILPWIIFLPAGWILQRQYKITNG
jgi:hypothetical protein